MSDEIKETLNLLNFNRDSISNGTCRVEDFMSREQVIKLLDYIINLQQENERLNNIINEVADEMLKELNENHHLSYGVALALRQKLISYKEINGSDNNEK